MTTLRLERLLGALTVSYVVVVALVSVVVLVVTNLNPQALGPTIGVVLMVANLIALFVLGMVAFFDDPAIFFREFINRRDRRLRSVRHRADTGGATDAATQP